MSRFYASLASATMLVLGVYLAFGSYHYPLLIPNYLQLAGSVLLWTGALMLLFMYPMADAFRIASRFTRSPKGAMVGGAYLFFHLLLYGYILEGILVYLYGAAPFVSAPLVFVSSNLLYPASLVNAVAGLAFNPNVTILVPPIYDASLSSFSIFTAILIDVLILANVAAVGQIGRASSAAARGRAYVAMPAVGIALGASCCMSLPLLLSIVDPALEFLSSLAWVYYLAYFVLPVLAAVLLKLNLDLASKAAKAAGRVTGAETGTRGGAAPPSGPS